MAKKCTGCDEIVSDLARICSRCGNDEFVPIEPPKKADPVSASSNTSSNNVPPVTPTASATSTSPVTNKVTCVECGASIEKGSAFCPACGRKDPTNPNAAPTNTGVSTKFDGFCTECGTGVQKSDAFCPACGKKDPMIVTQTPPSSNGNSYAPPAGNPAGGAPSYLKYLSLKHYIAIYAKTEKKIIAICCIIMYVLCGGALVSLSSSDDEIAPFLAILLVCAVIVHVKKSRIAAGIMTFFAFGCMGTYGDDGPGFVIVFILSVICLITLIKAGISRKKFTKRF